MNEIDRKNQRKSFVYGNTKMANDFITKELVDDVDEKQKELVLSKIEDPWYKKFKIEYHDFHKLQTDYLNNKGCDKEYKKWEYIIETIIRKEEMEKIILNYKSVINC